MSSEALTDEQYRRYRRATHEIYFIRRGCDRVKIGICRRNRVSERLAELQIGSPDDLALMGTLLTDNPGVEPAIHRSLGALRIRGEWFQLADGFRERIQQLCADVDSRLMFVHADGASEPPVAGRVARCYSAAAMCLACAAAEFDALALSFER